MSPLPRIMNRVLPYVYILVGALSAVLFDSTVIMVAAMLMVIAGITVLVMRQQYYRRLLQMRAGAAAAGREFVERSGGDRRTRPATAWPLVDYRGRLVEADRRVQDRRVSSA